MTEEQTPKKKKGFASMTAEQRRRIASLGGKAAHRLGRAHEFNSEEAKKAGSKGGKQRKKNHDARKKVSQEVRDA